jgi:hypothetical protein
VDALRRSAAAAQNFRIDTRQERRMKMQLAAVLTSLAAVPAFADCSWDWLCNGEGVCKQMPICDSVNELPPPRPETSPPNMPPLAMRPDKIAGPMGTLTCEHIMRKTKSGKWRWFEACFCTDPNKTRDPSAPFANIVRCDSQEQPQQQ